jgi:hypothetical protein
MDGFLVLARCGIDDIPLLFTESRDDATDFALAVTRERIQQVALDVFKIDVTDFMSVDVVTFDGGFPVHAELVQDFEE